MKSDKLKHPSPSRYWNYTTCFKELKAGLFIGKPITVTVQTPRGRLMVLSTIVEDERGRHRIGHGEFLLS